MTIRPIWPLTMVAVLVVIAVWAVGYGFSVSARTGVMLVGPMTLLIACAWLFLGNPHVEVDDWSVRVVNPLRTYDITFASMRDVTTRWALTLATTSATVVAWSAPGTGRAAIALRSRWELARTSGALDNLIAEPVTTEWNASSIGFVIVGVIMTAGFAML